MAHYDKFTRTQVGGVLEHNSRTDATRPHNHSNEDIDPSRTKDNYELHDRGGLTAQQKLKQRLSEVHCMQRDDVIVMASLVVTLPKDVRPEDERKFFQSVYDYACKVHGRENIVNATVHKDETTPHIHIGFVPVIQAVSKKGEIYEKVRCRDIIKKSYLNRLHDDLSDHVANDLGYEVSILNGATANGNKKIMEMKAERAKARADAALEDAAAAERLRDQKLDQLADLDAEIALRQEQLDHLDDNQIRHMELYERMTQQSAQYQEFMRRISPKERGGRER